MTPTFEEREELLQRYASDEECEANARTIAELRERIARDEMLTWCHQRNAERRAAETTPARTPERESAMTNNTDRWTDFVRREIAAARTASEKCLLGAIADAMIEERTAHRKEVDELRATVADLAARVDKLEGVQRSATPPHLRAV